MGKDQNLIQVEIICISNTWVFIGLFISLFSILIKMKKSIVIRIIVYGGVLGYIIYKYFIN